MNHSEEHDEIIGAHTLGQLADEVIRLRRSIAEGQTLHRELTRLLVAAEGDDLVAVVRTIIEQRDEVVHYAEQLKAALTLAEPVILDIFACRPVDGDVALRALTAIDAALAKNPNPSGLFAAEASGNASPEASGPVGLGPDVTPARGSKPDYSDEAIHEAANWLGMSEADLRGVLKITAGPPGVFHAPQEKCANCRQMYVHHSDDGKRCLVTNGNGGFTGYHRTKVFAAEPLPPSGQT